VDVDAGSSLQIAFRSEATMGRFAASSGESLVSVDGLSAFFVLLFLADGGFVVVAFSVFLADCGFVFFSTGASNSIHFSIKKKLENFLGLNLLCLVVVAGFLEKEPFSWCSQSPKNKIQ
jgi:hypothetical protein